VFRINLDTRVIRALSFLNALPVISDFSRRLLIYSAERGNVVTLIMVTVQIFLSP